MSGFPGHYMRTHSSEGSSLPEDYTTHYRNTHPPQSFDPINDQALQLKKESLPLFYPHPVASHQETVNVDYQQAPYSLRTEVITCNVCRKTFSNEILLSQHTCISDISSSTNHSKQGYYVEAKEIEKNKVPYDHFGGERQPYASSAVTNQPLDNRGGHPSFSSKDMTVENVNQQPIRWSHEQFPDTSKETNISQPQPRWTNQEQPAHAHSPEHVKAEDTSQQTIVWADEAPSTSPKTNVNIVQEPVKLPEEASTSSPKQTSVSQEPEKSFENPQNSPKNTVNEHPAKESEEPVHSPKDNIDEQLVKCEEEAISDSEETSVPQESDKMVEEQPSGSPKNNDTHQQSDGTMEEQPSSPPADPCDGDDDDDDDVGHRVGKAEKQVENLIKEIDSLFKKLPKVDGVEDSDSATDTQEAVDFGSSTEENSGKEQTKTKKRKQEEKLKEEAQKKKCSVLLSPMIITFKKTIRPNPKQPPPKPPPGGVPVNISAKQGDKKFECSHCKCKFQNWQILRRHMLVHKNTHFKCPHCDHESRNVSDHSAHLKTHSKSPSPTKSSANTRAASNVRNSSRKSQRHPEEMRMFECSKCEFRCRDINLFMKHITIHEQSKEYSCNKCNFTTNDFTEFKSHVKIHDDTWVYGCEKCDYKTKTEAYFKRHMLAHEGTKIFSCDKCDYNSNLSHSLKTHKKTHSENVLYSCNRCSYDATQKCYLKVHLKVHEGKPVFTCPECDFVTGHEEGLEKHLDNHEGGRWFDCPECDYKATGKSELQRHMTIHDRNTLYVCEKCNYNTNVKIDYLVHEAEHEGKTIFCCDKCDFTTDHKFNLTKHEKIHQKAKGLVCTKCNFTAFSPAIFKSHIKKHLTKRVYTCYICDHTVNERRTLLMHMRTHDDGKADNPEDSNDIYDGDDGPPNDAGYDSPPTPPQANMGESGVAPQGQQILPYMSSGGSEVDKQKQNDFFKKPANSSENQNQGVKPFKCVTCTRSFDSWLLLKDHLQEHYGAKPDSGTDKQETSDSSSKDPSSDPPDGFLTVEYQDEDVFKCLSCNVNYDTWAALKRHLQSEHDVSVENMDLNIDEDEQGLEEPPPTDHMMEVDSR